MPIKLEAKLINRLLEQPESGMGYQIVNVETRTQWLTKEAIVLNAELLLYLDDTKEFQIFSTAKTFDEIKKSASVSTNIVDLKVKPRYKLEKFSMVRETPFPYSAKSSPVELTEFGERFKRFTGFKNDLRINSDGSLKPGTYATTEEDARNVKIRTDAIKRYALPAGNTAQYVFTIKPLKDIEIKKGIVQSNFGQHGGGVEIFFVNGTSPKTVALPPEEVPEK